MMKYVLVPILARNVLFSKETEKFLKELERKAVNPFLRKYIKSNLNNWIINEYKATPHTIRHTDPSWVEKAVSRGDTVYNVDITEKDKAKINHWLDYLNTLDGSKIYKISIPQLIKQVEKWDKQLAKNLGKSAASDEDGIKIVGTFDGFVWVDVFGRDSLKREGDSMGHCVGGENYYKHVKEGNTKIYSLRDSNNKPHVTIEYSPKIKKLEQVKGKENKPPISKYRKSVIDFINTLELDYADNVDLLPIGLFFNENEDGEEKLTDFLKSEYLSGTGKFEYEDNENPLNLESINFSDIEISDSKFACKNVVAQNVSFWDSWISVENISAEESFEIHDCFVKQGITIQSRQVVLETQSEEYFSVTTDECDAKGNNYYFFTDSEIENLNVESETRIKLGSDVHVASITVNGLEPNPDDILQIELGENNSIDYFDICYSDVDRVPKGFKSKQLRINFGDNVKVSSNVKVDKLIVNDFSDIYESTPQEIFSYIARFNPSIVSYSNYGELAMSEEDYEELSRLFDESGIKFIQN